jgi:hypothetical protein
MGVFVDRDRSDFHIKNTPPNVITPTTILTADEHPIDVETLNVSNKMNRPIRFNLKLVTIDDEEFDLIPGFPIEPATNVDLISKFGLNIRLQYMDTPSVSDRLVCYVGYNQECDCTITYMVYNELPLV